MADTERGVVRPGHFIVAWPENVTEVSRTSTEFTVDDYVAFKV